jgi:hypothetical protein
MEKGRGKVRKKRGRLKKESSLIITIFTENPRELLQGHVYQHFALLLW